VDADGMLCSSDSDLCCYLRKVAPLHQALDGFDGWITGRKRFQSAARARLSRIEAAEGRIKINPLADWGRDDIKGYFAEHGLPPHPLEADGFRSIGCMPCTDRVTHAEEARDGRWRGQARPGQDGMRHPYSSGDQRQVGSGADAETIRRDGGDLGA
jgi:phosphoadenosine phosphosulfate reductase